MTVLGNPLTWFRGLGVVARQEFVGNLRSARFIIMALVTALVIVGGAYGLSGLSGGLFQGPPLNIWAHPAYEANGSHVAVAWVSNPFGEPQSGITVVFEEPLMASRVRFAEAVTDAQGFARAPAGNRTFVFIADRQGLAGPGSNAVFLPPPTRNFTVESSLLDADRDGFIDDLGVHVVTLAGDPASAQVLVNGTQVGATNSVGYARIELPRNTSNVTIRVDAEELTTAYTAIENPVVGGPDLTVAIIAGFFAPVFMTMFAIVITFDAVSKERVQGTLDLLLSRPVSRTGVMLGKFLGSFLAVALPVTLVNIAGLAVVAGATGQAISGGLAAAFVGLSLMLIAHFVLLQLTLSSIAKSSGSAILFGILAWLVFNLLYNIVVALVSLPFSPETQFNIQQAAAVGSPSQVYTNLVLAVASATAVGGIGGTTLGGGALAAAAVFWSVFLLVLALWTFQKRAVE